jgi:hypothetical protein
MLQNLRTMPLRGPVNETARIAAIRELLDRGYGRSRQAMARVCVFASMTMGRPGLWQPHWCGKREKPTRCSPKFIRTNHRGWHRDYSLLSPRLRRARGDGEASGLEQHHEPIHRLPSEKCQTLPSMLALPTTHPRYVSSSSIALACFKSNVSKPSVNQP